MFDKMQKEIDRFYKNADKFINNIKEIDLFDADQALTALGRQRRRDLKVVAERCCPNCKSSDVWAVGGVHTYLCKECGNYFDSERMDKIREEKKW
jgi:Zn ribbon nucleic-acid-binding protein